MDISHLNTRGMDLPDYLLMWNDFDIVYAPSNNFTKHLMNNVQDEIKKYNLNSKTKIEPTRNNKELRESLKNKTISNPFKPDKQTQGIGVFFSKLDSINNSYTLEIRTTFQRMLTNTGEDSKMTFYDYLQSGFITVELILERCLLRKAGVNNTQVWLFDNFPSTDTNVAMLTSILYVFLVFAYVFMVVSAIKDVMSEKECGTKELMKVMGVDSWMIWLHWFVYIMLVQFPVVIVVTVILTVWKPVVIHAGVCIVFLLLLLFTINLALLLFTVSCLFHKTTGAITTCLIGWFVINVAVFVKIISEAEHIGNVGEMFITLYPPVNLCWALSSLYSFDSYGVPWSWGHLFTVGYTQYGVSVGGSILAFILSTCICIFALLYLDAIFPGPFGVPKPLNFVCQWMRELCTSTEPYEDAEIDYESPQNFEPAGKNVKAGIMLRGLQKKYGYYRKKVAVENVDLDIYQGEIMALLGHNGAGKTTTMSMITGMTAPTKGAIVFEGQDITVNKRNFRESLGLCPQHNLYFSKMTVLEHLMFFGMLKGVTYFKSKSQGKSVLFSLNMLDKAATRGSKLSGGMKRRLCLAVSLIGNPKVLVLDEPTSGLDPETRRLIWDIILQMRGDRTVLITTHFMEEADVLGDRIAIMDHGRVVCCGTSLFLKKLFGAGYQVHVLKSAKASVEEITSVVKQNVSQPVVKSISNVQVDYIIKEEFVERFPALFSALERQKGSLNITGITLTCASMEDVFLKVANLPVGGLGQPVKSEQPLSAAMNINEYERHTGLQLFSQKTLALLEKRIVICKRQIIPLIIKIFIILLVTLFLALDAKIEKTTPKRQQQLALDLNLYPDAKVLIACDESFKGFNKIGEKVASLLSGKIKKFSKISDLDHYLKRESDHDNKKFIRENLFAVIFKESNIEVFYHQNNYVHSAAIAVNFVANVFLHNITNGSGTIRVINFPFVNLDAEGVCSETTRSQFYLETTVVYPCLFFFSIVFVVLLSNPLGFVTEERVTGFKHQQYLSGVSPPVYWFINLIFDLFVYSVVTFLFILVLIIFGPQSEHRWNWALMLIYFLQGLSGVSLTYFFSFFVNSLGTSLVMYSILMISLGVFPALIISTGILQLLKFVEFPTFLLIIHLLSLNPVAATIFCTRYILRAIMMEEVCRVCSDISCPKDSEVYRMPTEDDYSGILPYLYVLICTSIIYPIILLFADCGLVSKILQLVTNREPNFYVPLDTDDDVKVETRRVEAYKYEGMETPLRVESLEKKYRCGPKAVNKVSFIVLKGDCFGLLGVNGAGKSTTFKMLTAEIVPDKGDAFVSSLSLISDRSSYMQSVGYCPQTDAMLPYLTGEEILSVIAKIRGIPSVEVKRAVALWLDVMGITEHGGKCCGTYSGGTKRKLSTAMALIGSPEVVFMDEPTTGVDPASRRKLWSVIKEMQKQGQAVVLTSHSMEECEALCSRLTIMVGGQMKCIGNVEYLKTKFGKGFTVLVKLNEHTAEERIQLQNDFNQMYPANAIKDQHHSLIHYTILDPTILLSQLFTDMLKFKRDHPVLSDFTAYNTTLEELFLSFATNTQQRLVDNAT